MQEQNNNETIQKISTIDTNHTQMIHDAQYDHYSRLLATCSSDGFIKIFDVQNNQNRQLANIKAHNGPVWQISWGHPQFGNILASCGFDKKVSVWREDKSQQWVEIISHTEHEGSVNSIQWGPSELGLILLAGSQDGFVSILQRTNDDRWQPVQKIKAHDIGVNSISWAPLQDQADSSEKVIRFATGSSDGTIKIWKYNHAFKKYEQTKELNGHNREWVRDVAWNPSTGPYDLIASCSEDQKVIIWHLENREGEELVENEQLRQTLNFEGPVWRVSWSPQGNMLAVSYATNNNQDQAVKVFQENAQGIFDEMEGLDDLSVN